MQIQPTKRNQGFTLLELMSVIVVIGILIVLLTPAIGSVRSRVEKVRCIANLRGLYAGAELYLQQKGHWPQVDPNLLGTDKKAYAKAWIEILQPVGLYANSWICPTVQRAAGGPDFTKDEFTRIDYYAMPFDEKAVTPHRWPGAPWFVEGSDTHGSGNLVIFTDGSVRDLNDVKKSPPRSSN